MNSKNIVDVFENYLKARLKFVQQIAEAAGKSVQVDFILKCGAVEHLIPLLTDPSVKVQQFSALAMGRLVNNSLAAAQCAIQLDVIPILIRGMDDRSKFYKKSAMFTLRGLAQHSSDFAELLLTFGALDGIINGLEDFDPGVKESAIWAISVIVRHCTSHAEAVVAAGVLPYLKLALEEPEICVRQISACALSDIARHDTTLAQSVIESGVVPCLAKCILNPSPKLKKNAFCCLSNIAKHNEQMAEVVLESDVVSEALLSLGSNSGDVKKAASSLICNIAKHHSQYAQLIVNSGGLGGLVNLISNSEESTILPSILTIGFISSEAEFLALAAIDSKTVEAFLKVLETCSDEGVKCGAIWAIGQVGKHSAQHANIVARTGVLMKILKIFMSSCDNEDLKQKCKGTLKLVIRKCLALEYLEPLIHVAPIEILKYVIIQFSHVLPFDPQARRLFVSSGSLKRLQEIHEPPGTTIMECINNINKCFPEEVIRYYSPTYPELLLEEVENYNPGLLTDNITVDDPEEVDEVTEINVPPRALWESCLG